MMFYFQEKLVHLQMEKHKNDLYHKPTQVGW